MADFASVVKGAHKAQSPSIQPSASASQQQHQEYQERHQTRNQSHHHHHGREGSSRNRDHLPLSPPGLHAQLRRVDCGVNYASHKYSADAIAGILKEAKAGGVEAVLCISNSIPEVRRNVELALTFAMPVGAALSAPNHALFFFTCGCHPHHAKEFKGEKDVQFLRAQLLAHPLSCVAVGECGLDYNRNFSPPEVQRDVFRRQIRLAKELRKMMYLHCRDAFGDFVAILREEGYTRGIVHCFTGTLEEAQVFVDMGFKLGVTGFLLDRRRNAATARAIAHPSIPLESLIVETDAPFMAVYPRRSSRPEDTALVLEEIARLKGMDIEVCAQRIYETTMAFILSSREESVQEPDVLAPNSVGSTA